MEGASSLPHMITGLSRVRQRVGARGYVFGAGAVGDSINKQGLTKQGFDQASPTCCCCHHCRPPSSSAPRPHSHPNPPTTARRLLDHAQQQQQQQQAAAGSSSSRSSRRPSRAQAERASGSARAPPPHLASIKVQGASMMPGSSRSCPPTAVEWDELLDDVPLTYWGAAAGSSSGGSGRPHTAISVPALKLR